MLLRVAALMLLLLLAACAGRGLDPGVVPEPGYSRSIGPAYQINGVWYRPRHQPGYDEVGIASWYGPGFHGRRTASGQIYDQNAMTAAHTTLPLGSRVRVTHLGNGRSVMLTVNDRGPFVAGRIIDVSRGAARQLGLIGPGTGRVRVQLAEPRVAGAARRVPASPTATDTPHIQSALDARFERASRGATIAWRNPVTGRHGVIVPLTAPTVQSSPLCRNYRRTAVDPQASEVYIGRACRQHDGRWRIVRESPAPALSTS